MSNQDMGKVLYDLLPPVYKEEDAKVQPTPYPLKRYFQIAGKGLDELGDKIEGQENLFDPDKAPKELLPYLASMMGFTFPYEMKESEQRQLLKMLPVLYKYKGSKRVFNFLGQVIFGEGTVAESSFRVDEENVDRYIDLNIKVDGELNDIGTRSDRYIKFAERFRPLNTRFNIVVSLFYAEMFDRDRLKDSLGETLLFTNNDTAFSENFTDVFEDFITLEPTFDTFDSSVIVDSLGREIVRETEEDELILDTSEWEYIKVREEAQLEDYDKERIDEKSEDSLLSNDEDGYNVFSGNDTAFVLGSTYLNAPAMLSFKMDRDEMSMTDDDTFAGTMEDSFEDNLIPV